MMNSTFISVPIEEYTLLLEQAVWLRCLENAGVDNWEGIDQAKEEFTNDYDSESRDDI